MKLDLFNNRYWYLLLIYGEKNQSYMYLVMIKPIFTCSLILQKSIQRRCPEIYAIFVYCKGSLQRDNLEPFAYLYKVMCLHLWSIQSYDTFSITTICCVYVYQHFRNTCKLYKNNYKLNSLMSFVIKSVYLRPDACF